MKHGKKAMAQRPGQLKIKKSRFNRRGGIRSSNMTHRKYGKRGGR